MAEGAIERSHADIALAVTGYAGAAPPGEEAGLVHFACGRRGGLTAHREAHFGDIGRGPVRNGAIRVALAMMTQALGQGLRFHVDPKPQPGPHPGGAAPENGKDPARDIMGYYR